jgi:hypothetical protein
MVAYSFQRRFAEPIIAGTKGGTIRADRRRHARPGEELQLYVGMRTKQCRLITRETCIAVDPISLDLFYWQVSWSCTQRWIKRTTDLDALAVFDGFQSFAEMQDFWLRTHHATVFRGWHIRWLPLPEVCN